MNVISLISSAAVSFLFVLLQKKLLSKWTTLAHFLIFYTTQNVSVNVKTMLAKLNAQNNNTRKHYYILFRETCSNRKSNTLHNILKANRKLFFLTLFMRISFVLPRTSSLPVFARLYFELRSQVSQLVLRQPLTRVVLLFLAVQLPDFNSASAFSSAVSFTVALTSHIIFRSTFSSF